MRAEARRKWRHVAKLSRRLSSRKALLELLSLTGDSTLDPDHETAGRQRRLRDSPGRAGTLGSYAMEILSRTDHRAVPALLELAQDHALAASQLARVVRVSVGIVPPEALRAAATLVGRDVGERSMWIALADLRDGMRAPEVLDRTLQAIEGLPDKLTSAPRQDDDPELLRRALSCFRARGVLWERDPRVRAQRLVNAVPSALADSRHYKTLGALADEVRKASDQGARDDLVMALCVDAEPLRRHLLVRAIHQDPPLPDAHTELLSAAYRRRLADPGQRADAANELLLVTQVAAALSDEWPLDDE